MPSLVSLFGRERRREIPQTQKGEGGVTAEAETGLVGPPAKEAPGGWGHLPVDVQPPELCERIDFDCKAPRLR